MRGRTSTSVVVGVDFERAPREPADARAARELARRRDPHARGPVARGDERQLARSRRAGRGRAPARGRPSRRGARRTRRAAAPSSPAASRRAARPRCRRRAGARRRCAGRPRRRRAPRDAAPSRAFSSVPVSSSRSGCTGMPAGLSTASQPGPCARTTSPAPGIGERALLVAARERRHLELASAREAHPLFALAERAPVQAHGAAREQPAHLGARELELLGQEQVETPSRVLRRNDERARRLRSRRQGSRTLTAFRGTPQSEIPKPASEVPWRAPGPRMSQ